MEMEMVLETMDISKVITIGILTIKDTTIGISIPATMPITQAAATAMDEDSAEAEVMIDEVTTVREKDKVTQINTTKIIKGITQASVPTSSSIPKETCKAWRSKNPLKMFLKMSTWSR